MDFFVLLAGGLAVAFALLSVFLLITLERARNRSRQLDVQMSASATYASTLQKQLDEEHAQGKIDRELLIKAREEAVTERLQAEKHISLMKQQVEAQEKRMQDWETHQQQFTKIAQSSIMEAGSKMSSKLLEDHKRETEAAKKDSELLTKKTTEGLMEQFKVITESVASLKDQTVENKEKMTTVMRALSSPGGAGYLAEIGLENSLKNLGLEAGRDYSIQYSIGAEDGAGGLRPDAVIFLPQDVVMVVDCKASKFLLDIAEATSEAQEIEAHENLKRTMNQHLRALASKEYNNAVVASFKSAGKGDKIRYALNVMYLPNEGTIDRIKKADPEFGGKVEKAGLILAGPASLAGLFSLARLNIGMARQAENQDVIISAVQKLMDNVLILMSHAEGVGKGIKSAASHFDNFAASFNKNMISSLKRLSGLGVKPSKHTQISGGITRYDVRALDDMQTIDGEAENVDLRLLEKEAV